MPKINPKFLLRRVISPPARSRPLRFDTLEERRLLAGLEGGGMQVFVFEDAQSLRYASDVPTPAAERVVYVDLNVDGEHQPNEPIAITNERGMARWDGLAPGAYAVRLLGNHRSVSQTTSTVPATSGAWTEGLKVQNALRWDSDTTGWFATSEAIQRLDVESGEILHSIPVRGTIVSSVLVGDEGFAIVQRGETQEFVAFHIADRSGEIITSSASGVEQLLSIGNTVWVRAATPNGSGLYRVHTETDSSQTLSIQIERVPGLDGFSADTSVHPMGGRSLVVIDPWMEGSRVATYQLTTSGWELASERLFDAPVQFSSGLADDSKFALESPEGILILNHTMGLPTLDILEDAIGPTVFDVSRGLMLSGSKSDASRLLGWSYDDGSLQFDVGYAQYDSLVPIRETRWSLGYMRDSLIGLRDGALYRHALNRATATPVVISEGTLQQVAIGIRSHGLNRRPTLQALPEFTTDEDQSIELPTSVLTDASADPDGDSIYYLVRRGVGLGALQWSAQSLGLYQPLPDANGVDRWTIQAFDGKDWSLPQTLVINIRPVNDPPRSLGLPSIARVPEREPGATIASVHVDDPDRDAMYRYVVSDSRFAVNGGTLSLQPGVALDYEDSPILVLSVTAIEVVHGDSISGEITVHVQDRNDPPQGIILTGNGSVPEKVPGYRVGNISVLDPDRSEKYDISVSDPRFEVVGNVVRVKPGTSIRYQDPGWIDLTFRAVSTSNGDSLERTERLRVIKDSTPYHNDHNPMDVDGDGFVTPLDSLIIINYINAHGSGPLTGGEGEAGGDLDVDGDGRVSPLDILIVINAINQGRLQNGQGGSGSGEGDGSNHGGGGGGAPPEGEGEGAVAPESLYLVDHEDTWMGRRNRRR